MSIIAHEIHLKSRPKGLPTQQNFIMAKHLLAKPALNELIVHNRYFSVDPYMRLLMDAKPSFTKNFQLNSSLEGAAIGEVIVSSNEHFPIGSMVAHYSGWRDYALINTTDASLIDTSIIPAPTYLGAMGNPGFSAYIGLIRFGYPKLGETIFVSAASGAVGSIVVQIAKLRGCRVIASAGNPEKIRWLKDALGVDEVINYRETDDLITALHAAAPDGIDVYFDNVGGNHLEAAIENANENARFVLCGYIGEYNSTHTDPRNKNTAVKKNISMSSFDSYIDGLDLVPDFQRDMIHWITEGKVISRETVVEGLDNAPSAFIGLFTGNNIGKMLVKITT